MNVLSLPPKCKEDSPVGHLESGVGQRIVREKRNNPSLYTWFYEHVLSYVVGKLNWRNNVCLLEVTLFASVGDEAMALLMVENPPLRAKPQELKKSPPLHS